MKRLMSALALCLILVTGAAAAKDWTRLRIATEGEFPPWNQSESAGKLVGFEVDLARELCRRMKVECEIIRQDWEGMIPALQSGKVDAIMAAMAITEERLKRIDFAGPYAIEPNALITRADSVLAKALARWSGRINLNRNAEALATVLGPIQAALKDRTIGVQTATTQQAFVTKHLSEVPARTYEKFDPAITDLAGGRIDAVMATRSVLAGYQAKDPRLAVVGPDFTGGVLGRGAGVGLRKADSDLLAKFQQAIEAATADGTVTAIAQLWFGFDISAPPYDNR